MFDRMLTLGAGLALAAGAVFASRPALEAARPPVRQEVDLDRMSDAQLQALIVEELNDILEHLEPNRLYPLDECEQEILDALSDEGDEDGDDPDNDDDIDMSDYEEEMEEAGTSIEEVVDAAMNDADGLASIDAPRREVGHSTGDDGVAEQPRVPRDRRTTPRVAVSSTARRIVVAVRAGK